jgi:hypothetical protein
MNGLNYLTVRTPLRMPANRAHRRYERARAIHGGVEAGPGKQTGRGHGHLRTKWRNLVPAGPPIRDRRDYARQVRRHFASWLRVGADAIL